MKITHFFVGMAHAQIQSFLLVTPPKSSRFASAVLRTFDFVGIAPEKENA